MTDRSQPAPTINDPSATDAGSPLARARKFGFSLWAGSQTLLLEEMLFAGNEMLQRAMAETTIFNEFVSKLAKAHSVRDVGAMVQECTRHQMDFIRRDTERLLDHGGRMIDNSSKLLEVWRQN